MILLAGLFRASSILVVPLFLAAFLINSKVSGNEDTNMDSAFFKVLPCLQRSMNDIDIARSKQWRIPTDAQAHYEDLLVKTKPFRMVPQHAAANYRGPWIENHYLQHFMSKPLSYFGGLIPLFIQFVDIHVYSFTNGGRPDPRIPKHEDMFTFLSQLLRKDVIYVVVSQDDEGIGPKFQEEYPNILVLSAGGYGHVPIPLIKGTLVSSRPRQSHFPITVSFCGTVRMSRAEMFRNMQVSLEKHRISLVAKPSNPHWKNMMEDTLFNLAPRGFGRTSYRLAEIIQLGRIPVYMYDDYEWLPYGTSSVSVSSFGFSVPGLNATAVDEVAHIIANIARNNTKVQMMLNAANAAKGYYTYNGVVQQIEKFFTDPFGVSGGHLACAALPPGAKSH